MHNVKHIVVVGGGSIGASFVSQLVDEGVDAGIRLEISVIEKSGHVGGGEAYMEDTPSCILNTRADTMSANSEKGNDFLNWLHAREEDWRKEFPEVAIEKGAYLPRSLFGRYLESVYAEAERVAMEAGIGMRLIKGEVLDIVAREEGFDILMKDKQRISADTVMLCPGNLPSNTFPHLEGIDGYFNSPYPLNAVSTRIEKDAAVGVVGASLSGIDTLLGLKKHGHTGKMICVSRRGRFPSVRGQNNRRYRPEIIVKENVRRLAEAAGGRLSLEDVAFLIVQEIEHADDYPFNLEEVLNDGVSAYEYLQSEIALAQGKERMWQSVIYSLNSVIDTVWHYLAEEDKARFMCDLKNIWLSYRVSFPVQNALKLQQMLRTDQLSQLGGLKGVEYDAGSKQFLLELVDERTGFSSQVRSKYLVNATGYTSDVTKCRVPLIRNLLKRGLARPSPYTGFEVDFHSGTVQGDSVWHSDHLYALGALATGAWLFTNGFDVNVRYARQAARRIIEQCEIGQGRALSMVNREQVVAAGHDH